MNKCQIIERIYKSGFVPYIVAKYLDDKSLLDDGISEIYLILCEQKEAKLVHLQDEASINFFIVKLAKNTFSSVTSPFYKKYRLPRKLEISYEDKIRPICCTENDTD